MLYSEISGSPLKTLEVILSTQYAPLVSASNEWDRANHDQQADLNTEVNIFIGSISSALSSISDGLELRLPKWEYIEAYTSMDSKEFLQKIGEAHDTTSHFEELAQEWYNKIEARLVSSDSLGGSVVFPTKWSGDETELVDLPTSLPVIQCTISAFTIKKRVPKLIRHYASIIS